MQAAQSPQRSGCGASGSRSRSRSTTASSTQLPRAVEPCPLSGRELEVLKRLAKGMVYKQIAHELQVGDSTVKAHVSEILRKLEVISRTQIVIDTASLDFDQIHNSHSA